MRGVTSLLILAFLAVACGGGAASPSPSPSPSAPAMQVMASGQLKAVDGTASGKVELAVVDGAYEVVLDYFEIGSIEHTNVILVENAAVTMSDDIDPAKILDLGALKATSGMQVYAIPAEMASSVMAGYHSVVIWDTAMSHVIAAAPLK